MSVDATVAGSRELYGTFLDREPPNNHDRASISDPLENPEGLTTEQDVDVMCDDSINKTSLDGEVLDDGSMNNLMCSTTSSLGSSRWYRNVTVEPVILFFSLALTLSGPVNTSLFLEHTCVATLGYNETYCKQLQGNTDKALEAIVEPKANVYMMAATMIETCLPALLTLFVGPWSDHHGRKTFLLVPILGYLLKYSLYAAYSFYPTLSPLVLLTASVPVSLAGGLVSVISLSYCYITDVSTEQRRGFRMGILEAGFYSGLLLGTAASTYLFTAGGYVAVYATSAALCLGTFCYGVCLLPESIVSLQPVTCWLSDLFRVELVREMLGTCCKRREDKRRAVIFLAISALAVCVFSMEGDAAVQFQFTRTKFGWDIRDFTAYGSVSILLQIVGTVLGVSVLSAWLTIGDSLLALVSFLMKIISSVLLAVSPSSWWMYLGGCVGMFGAFAGPLCRSVLSKTVDRQDVGKVFSLLSALEAVTPLAAAPLYTLLYNATICSFPGAFYLLTAATFCLDALLLACVVAIQRVPTYTRVTPD